MKNLLFAACCYSAMLISCTNSPGKSNENQNTKAGPASATSSSAARGTISCTIDGTPYTHTVTAGFFEVNAETKLPLDPNDKNAKAILVLREQKEGFMFDIPNVVSKNVINESHKTNMGYTNKSGVMYALQTGEIDIASFNGNHLTGTFSGSFEKVNGEAGFPQTIKMENGKFDLHK